MKSKNYLKKKDFQPKLLFWYCGKPVYEGSELHKTLDRIAKEFDGDIFAAAKHDAAKVEMAFKELFGQQK